VKKKKKQIKKENLLINTSPEIKMSELIGAYASDYINMGETTEERQSYLNGACSAWNIAVLPEHLREEAVRRNIKEYKRINPGIDDADNLAHDLRKLIQKKLEMFPDVKKVIIDASIEPISDKKYRIVVASTDHPEQLKPMLTKTFSWRE
jgi:RNA-splicing ligase RtcB